MKATATLVLAAALGFGLAYSLHSAPVAAQGFPSSTFGGSGSLNRPNTDATLKSLSASTVTASTSVQTPVINGAGGNPRILLPSGGSTTIKGNAPDTSSVYQTILDTSLTISSGGLVGIANNGVVRGHFDKNGGYNVDGVGSLVVQSGSVVCFDGQGCTKTLSANSSGIRSTQSVYPTVGSLTLGISSNRWGALQLGNVTLGTCASGAEGTIQVDVASGGTGTLHRTRFCGCTSDGAASPTYAWRNLGSGTVGTSTTCAD